MSYNAIARMAQDTALQLRITACAAQEGSARPERWAESKRWELAVTPGWPAAYASALAGNDEAPGANEGVITDGMILAAVQPLLAVSSQTTEGGA